MKSYLIKLVLILVISTWSYKPLTAAPAHSISPSSSSSFHMNGFLEGGRLGDTVTLIVWDHLYSNSGKWNTPHQEIHCRINEPVFGTFRFNIPSLSGITYISLSYKKGFNNRLEPALNMYLAEPGDSVVVIGLGTVTTTFYGRGSEKFNCRFELDRKTSFNMSSVDISFPVDSSGQLSTLNNYRTCLRPLVYTIMKADIMGKYLMATHRYPGKPVLPFAPAALSQSRYYTQYLVQQAASVCGAKENDKTYDWLKNNYTGLLRDKLITFFLRREWSFLKNADSLLHDAITIVRSENILNELYRIKGDLTKDHPAFEFSLSNVNNLIVRQSDFKGKVVLLDFWFTGCTGCRDYYQNNLSVAENFYKNDSNVVFISINIDLDREKWLKSLRQGGYSSPESVNLNTAPDGINAAIIKHYNVSYYPFPILIDAEGKIFSTSHSRLRFEGTQRLIEIIQEALQKNKAST